MSGTQNQSFMPLLLLYLFFQGCVAAKEKPAICFAAASDTINTPMVIKALGDGSLLLRAEYGRPVGPKIRYMPKLRVYGYFTAMDKVEWEVDVRQAGLYDVYLEWAISDEESGKAFLFTAGEEVVKGNITSTGSFYTHKTEKIGSIALVTGKQKMVFRAGSDFEKGELVDLRGIWLQLPK